MSHSLSEKDALMDLLMQEKEIMKVYGSFLPEGSTAEIRGLMSNNLKMIEMLQFELFNRMQQKGYYQVQSAKKQDVQQTISNFE
ncbi:MAG: spore coat protein [Bacillota bacterium]|jgi:spore coat protein F|nr:spore coat protein [Bacillota bacterium]HHU43229.1 spore coat protein [Clostridiales bacterium]